jgi:predicted GNAT family acetyltransferase
MTSALDKPIWGALTSCHAEFAVGGALALRYRDTVEPFIAARDDTPDSLSAMRDLMTPGEELILLQARPSPIPHGVELVSERLAVQMIAERADPIDLPANVEPLGPADAAEMQALAELTKPGPFRAETHLLGGFFGIRHDGRLVAMAGERMKLPGFGELSGVCTHPDARGQGYGRLLSRLVAGRIAARGERPFLHAYADNAGAIGLYERLGFAIRTPIHVQCMRRAGRPPPLANVGRGD